MTCLISHITLHPGPTTFVSSLVNFLDSRLLSPLTPYSIETVNFQICTAYQYDRQKTCRSQFFFKGVFIAFPTEIFIIRGVMTFTGSSLTIEKSLQYFFPSHGLRFSYLRPLINGPVIFIINTLKPCVTVSGIGSLLPQFIIIIYPSPPSSTGNSEKVDVLSHQDMNWRSEGSL